MAPRYPTMAVFGLAGACALLFPAQARAEATAPACSAPVEEATPARKVLGELEGRATKDPKDWVADQAKVISLIDANELTTAMDFWRASRLLQPSPGDTRILQLQYELVLTAVALGEAGAESSLPMMYDNFMGRIGRPWRFDFQGWAAKNEDYIEYDPAPACIRAVWRAPAAVRATAAGTQDNAEILAIRDADQADRKGDWSNRAPEVREATIARDKARNARIREIVAAGEVRTANDFARAALVMQHSATFPRLRLAHELAVASLLLGDRQGGRWLVAASYDRLLLNAALPQRYGTQRGPDGPIRLDASGICDNQRLALGCPTLAQARSTQPGMPAITDKRILAATKPDNWIHEENTGLRFRYPSGWHAVAMMSPNPNSTGIPFFIADRTLNASAVFSYELAAQPAPASDAEAEAMLREFARTRGVGRVAKTPSYQIPFGSYRFRRVQSQPALSWIANYDKDRAQWSEYVVRVLGPGSVGIFVVSAPAERIAALQRAVDAMVDTLQLP